MQHEPVKTHANWLLSDKQVDFFSRRNLGRNDKDKRCQTVDNASTHKSMHDRLFRQTKLLQRNEDPAFIHSTRNKSLSITATNMRAGPTFRTMVQTTEPSPNRTRDEKMTEAMRRTANDVFGANEFSSIISSNRGETITELGDGQSVMQTVAERLNTTQTLQNPIQKPRPRLKLRNSIFSTVNQTVSLGSNHQSDLYAQVNPKLHQPHKFMISTRNSTTQYSSDVKSTPRVTAAPRTFGSMSKVAQVGVTAPH